MVIVVSKGPYLKRKKKIPDAALKVIFTRFEKKFGMMFFEPVNKKLGIYFLFFIFVFIYLFFVVICVLQLYVG